MTPGRTPGDAPVSGAVLLLPGRELASAVATGLCGGLTLVDRLLRQLRRAGVTSVILLERHGGESSPLPATCRRARVRWPSEVRAVAVDGNLPPLEALRSIGNLLPSRFLCLPANLLIDQRLLQMLLRRPAVTLLDLGEAPAGILACGELTEGSLAGRPHLRLAEVGTYHPELRRDIDPFLLRVTSTAELRRGSRLLLEYAQKGALDLPGKYFDTPFENLLVRLLAPTRVTPNHVTVATMAGAGAIALMFWSGWLVVGALLCLAIGVLDGVDGKLARLRLETSRLGELEHLGDFFYENAWYLAIADHLNLLALGWGMVAADLADNLAYLVVQRRHGLLLDEMSGLDRGLRLVAGRRNIYVWIFVVGFCGGAHAATFRLAAAWAVLTALVHWVRAFRALWWFKAPARPGGANCQAGRGEVRGARVALGGGEAER